MRSVVVALILACGAAAAFAQESSTGVVREVRVHGNHTTPDADVLAIIGEVVGKPATDALLAEVNGRLEKSGRFDGVEVLKRYRSIDDPEDVLLVVMVDEVPGIDELNLTPSPMKKFWTSGMFLPILHSEDGYGFTYGARVSFVELFGPRSRVTVPLTWGGERQARVQVERSFTGPLSRLAADGGIFRRENPFFEIGDTRTSFHGRAEGVLRKWLRIGGGGGVEDVQFGDLRDHLVRAGADVTLDTRVDPAYPRNAVLAAVGVERLSFDAGDANRRTADLRGYVGLFGQSVLALRSLTINSPDALPAYEQSLLGGAANLRGYPAGYKVGDNLSAFSAEVRVPITSPLSVGRFGVKAFVDAGASYDAGQKLSDQELDKGYGGGAYLHLTVVNVSLDVARGASTGDIRWHFGLGVTFK